MCRSGPESGVRLISVPDGRGHSDLYLDGIREVLTKAVGTLNDLGVREGAAPHVTYVTFHLVDRAASEARRAVEDLEVVREAWSPTAQALLSAPNLALTVQRNLDSADGRLESARRSVFRVS